MVKWASVLLAMLVQGTQDMSSADGVWGRAVARDRASVLHAQGPRFSPQHLQVGLGKGSLPESPKGQLPVLITCGTMAGLGLRMLPAFHCYGCGEVYVVLLQLSHTQTHK